MGLALLGALLYSKRDSLAGAWEAITNASIGLVLLLPVLQGLNFMVVGKYYQSMLAIFKVSMSLGYLWGVVAALTFVSQILPSGGISGLAYITYGFRNKVDAGIVGLIQLGRYVLSLASYFTLIPLILLVVWLQGKGEWISHTFDKIAHSPEAIGVLVGFGLIAVFVAVIFLSRKNTIRMANKIEIAINNVLNLFRRKKRTTVRTGTIAGAMHDFHDGFVFIKSHGLKILKPQAFMFLNTMFELAIVYTAFQAVGGEINVGILFISFIAAQIAGVVSIIPGDVGVHEGVMILMLSSLGVDESIAISATLLYRLFNKAIYLPVGFFFYVKLLKPAEANG